MNGSTSATKTHHISNANLAKLKEDNSTSSFPDVTTCTELLRNSWRHLNCLAKQQMICLCVNQLHDTGSKNLDISFSGLLTHENHQSCCVDRVCCPAGNLKLHQHSHQDMPFGVWHHSRLAKKRSRNPLVRHQTSRRSQFPKSRMPFLSNLLKF